jgi:hypothetical protein
MAYFEFTPASEIHTVWFVGNGSADLLAVVYRDTAADPWKATMRFRAYTGGSEPDADDSKHGVTITPMQSEPSAVVLERVLNATQKAVDVIAGALGTLVARSTLTICGGPDKFAEEVRKQPWAHVRVEHGAPEGRA